MTINDLYQITLAATSKGQDVLNVFYYKALANGLDAEEIATAFHEQYYPVHKGTVSGDVFFNEIIAINLFDTGDTFNIPLGEDGTFQLSTAQSLPVHDAVAMRLNRTLNVTRHGQKRIPGIAETQVDDGVVTGATYITALAALAAQIQEILLDTATEAINQFLPVIVKRIAVIVGGIVVGYRLPEDSLEAVSNPIASVDVDLEISTQNSRKVP